MNRWVLAVNLGDSSSVVVAVEVVRQEVDQAGWRPPSWLDVRHYHVVPHGSYPALVRHVAGLAAHPELERLQLVLAGGLSASVVEMFRSAVACPVIEVVTGGAVRGKHHIPRRDLAAALDLARGRIRSRTSVPVDDLALAVWFASRPGDPFLDAQQNTAQPWIDFCRRRTEPNLARSLA